MQESKYYRKRMFCSYCEVNDNVTASKFEA